ncbi:MAG: hypothetical protein H7A46_07110 [Verrucomicrobiales bacterium]|nr:hypothetical protein [Verrucomicrobiales bacterium]
MKAKADAMKETTPKTTKTKRAARTKRAKQAKPERNGERPDRLPSTLDELKATKGGLVSHLFFSGKGKDEIAKEVQAVFKLGEARAAKIVRRVTGRARMFQRAMELTAGK